MNEIVSRVVEHKLEIFRFYYDRFFFFIILNNKILDRYYAIVKGKKNDRHVRIKNFH